MPPKPGGKDAKAAKPKTNDALDFHADVDLKRLLDNAAKAAVKTPGMEPLHPFLRKAKGELQAIRDYEQFDIPNIPLFVFEPMAYDAIRVTLLAVDSFPWLRHLSLYHTRIGDDGAMAVADFLKRYSPNPDRNPFGIETLELPENDIGPRGAGYLGRVLTQNETVKTLNLDFNPLGDDGAGLLGDGLKWNSTLETLSMQHCGVGPEGGEMVAKYVVRSSSVKELSLRGNPLGPHGVTMIARSLAKNAYLVKLDLADTSFGIDLETIEALRDGIEGNESLEAVDLNYNSLVPAGIQLLLEMLKTKMKLQQFIVYERIGETLFFDMMDSVNVNIKAMKKKKKKGKGKAAAAGAVGARPSVPNTAEGAPPAAVPAS
jgi:hypothetical protein